MSKKSAIFVLSKKLHIPAAVAVVSLSMVGALSSSHTARATTEHRGTAIARESNLTGLLKPQPVGTMVPVASGPTAPAPAPAAPAAPAPKVKAVAPVMSASGLIGRIGYARAGGNCVNEPGVNRASGNPSSWPATHYTPHLGSTALWAGLNHTGVVVGIWSNGDLEIRHQNWWGGQHRFPRSAFRGFR